jgi:hypothetical protein
MSICKNNRAGFCTHYNAADPPPDVCANCAFFKEDKKECRHIYDGQWCLRIVNREHWWKRRSELSCANCNWE